METVNGDFFDLPLLLRHDDLNTRKFAMSERSVTVGEYFTMLSELLRLGSDVERALVKFASVSGEITDCRSLDNMIKLLTNMECDKFILGFHSLLNAYWKKGNWREAAFSAKQMRDEFNGFHSRLEGARRKVQPDSLPDLTVSLSKYIIQLDDEEARSKPLDDEETKSKPLILAVDDSPVILKSVSAVLSNDYKVFTMTKPTELEKVLRKLTPELFLIDYQMPELTGFDLIPIIRGFAEHQDTPIVFLTSEGTFDNITAAIALGVSDFIVKPVKPDVLREKIAKCIVKKKSF